MAQKDTKDDLPEIIPPTSYDLIDALDRAYPARCLVRGETLESAHRYAGLRELIDELVEWKRAEIEGNAEEAA